MEVIVYYEETWPVLVEVVSCEFEHIGGERNEVVNALAMEGVMQTQGLGFA